MTKRAGDVVVLPKDALGAYGERLAAAYLRSAGMIVLEQNWRCPSGEIDIIARDGSVLVICEVKTRSSEDYGSPLEAVTPRKAARLRRLAAAWVHESGLQAPEIRIDLVGVLRPRRGASRLDHVRGVA